MRVDSGNHSRHKRKSKKNKKLKKLRRQSRQAPDEVTTFLANQANPRSKFQKLLKEVEERTSREKIVLLFIEAAQRAENCFDFEISMWLERYNKFRESPNFTEAALLIINAAQIYSRKVDYLEQIVCKSISEDANRYGGLEQNNAPIAEKATKSLRRPLSLHDRLYEAESIAKKFKTIPLARTTEMLSTLSCGEPPTKYFKKWKEYKSWRTNHKKKMKSPLPYSIVCDDSHIHPAMWKLSCIEDFDYDDDTDTKRSFRMYTDYVEHRHSTLVPDINFIIHFKVKDFIEAEEDEIEIMKILGLPPPPSRTWPPFCKTSFSREYVKQKYNIDLHEYSEDYIKQYVALEDIVLEQDVYQIDDELLQSATQLKNSRLLPSTSKNNCDNDKSNKMLDSTDQKLNSNSNIIEQKNTETDKMHSEQNASSESTPCITSEIKTQEPNVTDTVLPSAHDFNDSIPQIDPSIIIQEDGHVNERASPSAIPPKIIINDITIIKGPTQDTPNINDIQNTKDIERQSISRCSVDEGISFREFRENDILWAMHNPVVELVDIFGPLKNYMPPSETITVNIDREMKNILAIDESYLNFKEHFILPFEVLGNVHNIKRNILGLPAKLLRKQCNFNLPSEFNLHKKARMTQKSIGKMQPERQAKLFKLSDRNIEKCPVTRPNSPIDDIDFLGFDETEINMEYEDFSTGDIFSSTLNGTLMNTSELDTTGVNKPRTVSRDSGIGESNVFDTQLSIITEETDNSKPINPNGIEIPIPCETLNDTTKSLTMENSACINSNNTLAESTTNETVTISVDKNNTNEITSDVSDADKSKTLQTTSISSELKTNDIAGEINQIDRLAMRAALNSDKLESTTNELIQRKSNEMNQMIEKVHNWHKYLKPILANSKDRHHFDIFTIGTEIMETFPNQTPLEQITFEQIMKNKDPSLLSRYFISMLQLTNSNNVQLDIYNRSLDLPTPPNNVYLKFLNNDRHTVSIEDNIGIHGTSRKRTYANISPVPSTSNQPSTSRQFNENRLSPTISEDNPAFIKKHDEASEKILQKYKESNREILSKEVNAHRDDYIRILSKKHDINLNKYFTPDEIQRVESSEKSENFSTECFIYPKRTLSNTNNAKRSRISDDLDSGVFSQSSAETSSVAL